MLGLRAFHKLLEISKKVPPNFSKRCSKKVINFLLKHCEIWNEGQFEHQEYFRIARKLKIAQYSKGCFKRKKVARNTKSCQKVAEIETQEEFKEN